MLVSHTKKFIFTKTKKTASTSVESFFEPYCMVPGQWKELHYRGEYISSFGIIGARSETKNATWWNHMPAKSIKKLLGREIWDSYYKFTTIRNPFSKLVSQWYFKEKNKTGVVRTIKKCLKYPSTLKYVITEKEDVYKFRQWIQSGGHVLDRDIYQIDGQACIDYFIKFEDLETGMKEVCNKIGVDFFLNKLPKFKKGIRTDGIPIFDFYDRRTKNVVKNLYSWELDKFGYSLNDLQY